GQAASETSSSQPSSLQTSPAEPSLARTLLAQTPLAQTPLVQAPSAQPQPPRSAQSPTPQQGEVYRSTLPNGEVIYSDKPDPGAKSSKPVPQANSGANNVAPAVTREEIEA